MFTSKMNERISFVSKQNAQDPETGELVPIEKELFSCWCEVKKMTAKEFRESTQASMTNESIQKYKETLVFYIRYQTRQPIDSTMKVNFRGGLYEITGIQPDYVNKDMTMLSCVRIS